MEHLKLFEEWNIKDPFGSKRRDQERNKEFMDRVKIDQEKYEKEGLENQNNIPIIQEIIDCIEKDEDCIVNAKSGTQKYFSRDFIVLSNGIKFQLEFTEDDAGYIQEYFIIVNKEPYHITKELYGKIKEKFDEFMEKTWGPE